MKQTNLTRKWLAFTMAAVFSVFNVAAQVNNTASPFTQTEIDTENLSIGEPETLPVPGGMAYSELRNIRTATPPPMAPMGLPRIFFPANPIKGEYDPNKSSEGEAQEDPASFSFETAAPTQFRNWDAFRRNNDVNGDVFIPPDPSVTAGLNHIVAAVNDDIRIYDKSGALLVAQDANTLFNTTDNLFNPKVVYDPWRDRYLILFMRRNTNSLTSYWSLAVSRTNNPTGDYWIYHLNARMFGNSNGSYDTNFWADNPQIGFDANAVYISAVMLPNATGSAHCKMRCLNKDHIYNGYGAGWWDYANLTSDGYNDYYIVPAQMWSYGSRTLIVSAKHNASDKLALRFLTWLGDGTWTQKWAEGPHLTIPITINVSSYAVAPNAVQPNGVQALNSVDTRLLSATFYSNKLHTAHMVGYNWGSGNRCAIKYYRIGISGTGTNATVERTKIFGSSTHDFTYPAITHTSEQDVVFVFSRVGSSTFPEARFTGWKNNEADIQASSLLQAGQATYLRLDNDNKNRWGEYSGASLDPFDQKTVWVIGEYARTSNQWGTWISEVNYKPMTTITAQNVSGVIGQLVSLQATVRRADNNQPLSDATVQFRINGTLINSDTTDANGLAVIFYRLPETFGVGNRNLTATMLGDGDYNGSTSNATVTINKGNTTLTVPAQSGSIGQTVNLTTTLRRVNDNLTLSGKAVTFKIADVIVGTANTNASGVATLSYALPPTFGTGSKTLRAEFAGDTLYNSTATNSTVTINKANTSITVNAGSGTIGHPTMLSATLRRTTDNGLISGRTLTFKLNGVAVGTAITNASGVASLSWVVQNGSLGNNVLSAEFAGDDSYNASNGQANFQRMSETRVTISNALGSSGTAVKLRATLWLHPDGAMLTNRPLQFFVNNVLVGGVTTNASGFAEFNYQIPANVPCASLNLRVSYAGETNIHPTSNNTGTMVVRLWGDVNIDGVVDDNDLLMVLFAFGQVGEGLLEDVDYNGMIDDNDLLIVLFNFGASCN